MKAILISIIFLLSLSSPGRAQLTKPEDIRLVKEFIELVRSGNVEELSKRVKYPLRRTDPIAEVKDAQEFKKRYQEIFDEKLIKEIIESTPATDWSAMGWRGIMLGSGTLWLDYDNSIIAVNQVSEVEASKIEAYVPLSEDEIIKRSLEQLNIKKSQVHEILLAVKKMPHYKTKSVVVIPQIAQKTDESDFTLNAYILVVNNTDAQILQQYYEPKAWTSDALQLTKVSIDFAPYKISDTERAFGIRTCYSGSSKANPYESEELSLFIEKGHSLIEILRHLEVKSSTGEWDTYCEGKFVNSRTLLLVSQKQTNGYFDLVAKSKLTTTVQFIKDGDCKSTETEDTKSVTLKFDGKKYE